MKSLIKSVFYIVVFMLLRVDKFLFEIFVRLLILFNNLALMNNEMKTVSYFIR